tara:strand:- start:65 stop:349 length:285 start_codon:yes stop_codon:yes gene_type:complete
MKQARELQSKIKETQKNLNKSIVEGSAGNNAVVIRMTGDQKLKLVKINPENIKNNQELEKLIFQAMNDTLEKSKKLVAEQMSNATGGLNIPGLT